MDEIFPHIYLGGSYAAENISTLLTKNISFVISIMSRNLPPSTREAYMDQRIEHVYIKKRDDSDEDILAVLGEMCKLIEERRQGGRGVLLHCAMGVSRSATVMAAYGMFTYLLDLWPPPLTHLTQISPCFCVGVFCYLKYVDS